MTRRRYPSRHLPGSHWSTDVAYNILALLPENVLDDAQFAYISGVISGALSAAADCGPLDPADYRDAPKLK